VTRRPRLDTDCGYCDAPEGAPHAASCFAARTSVHYDDARLDAMETAGLGRAAAAAALRTLAAEHRDAVMREAQAAATLLGTKFVTAVETQVNAFHAGTFTPEHTAALVAETDTPRARRRAGAIAARTHRLTR
jgi:hypothetical protein